MAAKRICFIRHAQCVMNLAVDTRIGGRSDSSPLTDLGTLQAKALGKHLAKCVARHHEIGPCFASTAVRARDTLHLALQTAKQCGHELLGSPQGLDVAVTLHEQLLELEQGEWEGRLRSECYTPETVGVINQDPWNFAPPGGESQKQVEERITSFIKTHVLPQIQPGGPPALVVSHGLAIKCFLRGLLNSDPAMTRKIQLNNTAVVEVAWRSTNEWEVLRVNDVAHLHLEEVLHS